MIPLRDDVPTTITPFVTVALIVACSLVFLWQFTLGEWEFETVVFRLGVIPATLVGGKELPPALHLVPPELTLFTSMFLHGGWMHLIGNMLYLWIFGNNVEDSMGHVRFVLFYLACGVIAALVQSYPDPNSTIPMIGASGAISGVLGAYLLLYPRAHVLVLLPLGYFSQLVHLPAMLVLGFWFLLQLINSFFAASGSGGVAWGAHIGGFIAGMILIPLFKRRAVRLWSAPRRRY
jgi:membrane associated rhomboid family serine protease